LKFPIFFISLTSNNSSHGINSINRILSYARQRRHWCIGLSRWWTSEIGSVVNVVVLFSMRIEKCKKTTLFCLLVFCLNYKSF